MESHCVVSQLAIIPAEVCFVASNGADDMNLESDTRIYPANEQLNPAPDFSHVNEEFTLVSQWLWRGPQQMRCPIPSALGVTCSTAKTNATKTGVTASMDIHSL